jgi:hypothetical protein
MAIMEEVCGVWGMHAGSERETKVQYLMNSSNVDVPEASALSGLEMELLQ